MENHMEAQSSSDDDARIVEFMGLTREAASLIESFRVSANETRLEIAVRVLRGLRGHEVKKIGLDLGQGALLGEGEKIYLFLNEERKAEFIRSGRDPHGVAQARGGALYIDGERVEPSKGSWLQPAMRKVQEKIGHQNARGELKSLDAWRQWYVLRDTLIATGELRDQNQVRKRGRVVKSLPHSAEYYLFGETDAR
jgi:hypothetical protein